MFEFTCRFCDNYLAPEFDNDGTLMRESWCTKKDTNVYEDDVCSSISISHDTLHMLEKWINEKDEKIELLGELANHYEKKYAEDMKFLAENVCELGCDNVYCGKCTAEMRLKFMDRAIENAKKGIVV